MWQCCHCQKEGQEKNSTLDDLEEAMTDSWRITHDDDDKDDDDGGKMALAMMGKCNGNCNECGGKQHKKKDRWCPEENEHKRPEWFNKTSQVGAMTMLNDMECLLQWM